MNRLRKQTENDSALGRVVPPIPLTGEKWSPRFEGPHTIDWGVD
eukprot:COSAG02_NODE_43194_length_377_cov_0.744604_2_plen_43_part_01